MNLNANNVLNIDIILFPLVDIFKTISIKIYFPDKEIRKTNIFVECILSEFYSMITHRFNHTFNENTHILSYINNSNEWINITNNIDWETAKKSLSKIKFSKKT